MSITEEAVNVAVGTEVAAKEPSKPTEKPVKEKKPKASKEKKPKSFKIASHPPYFEMIKEAVLTLKEKGGSSPYAIAKYVEEKHKAVLPANFRKILGLQLKKSASKGKLVKVKASYKLSESGKKDKATTKAPKALPAKTKKPEQIKSGAAKGVSKGKSAVKKTKVVAAATAKPKAKPVQKTKKPEQIKSGAAKGVSKGKSAVKKTKAVVAATAKPKAKPVAAATAKPKAKPVQKTKKRAAPTKAKAKQPKSIKSPAAKKTKKAVA